MRTVTPLSKENPVNETTETVVDAEPTSKVKTFFKNHGKKLLIGAGAAAVIIVTAVALNREELEPTDEMKALDPAEEPADEIETVEVIELTEVKN